MSKNYELVKNYHDRKLWNDKMVINVIGKWITKEEAAEILGHEPDVPESEYLSSDEALDIILGRNE